MKFWEAMKALEEGKKVRRSFWKENKYLSMWEHGMCLETKDPKSLLGIQCYGISHDDLKTSDWEIYEEFKPKLNFMQVVEGLKQGKKFRRECWIPYSYIVKSMINDYFKIIIGKDPIQNFHFKLEDFDAPDWIEVE